MWILATVLGLLLLFVVLLAIPVDLVICIEKDVDFRPRVRVKWLFGLIGKDITGRGKKPKKERKRKRNIKPLVAILRTRGFLQKLFKFIKRIFQLLDLRKFRLILRVGLDDPAETGLFFALIGPAMVCIKSFSSLDVQVEPDFHQESLRGLCEADLRVLPIQLAGPLLVFAISPSTIRAIRAMVVARRG